MTQRNGPRSALRVAAKPIRGSILPLSSVSGISRGDRNIQKSKLRKRKREFDGGQQND